MPMTKPASRATGCSTIARRSATRVGHFWSLTELSPTTTAHMLFDYDSKIFRIEYDKAMGMSVRCLKA
jgi:uncharacterized protein (TIGR02145 family)